NALKFTTEGGISLMVETSPMEGSGPDVLLRFSVRDSGIGIPREMQDQIFDPFTQADQSTSRRFGGTGLGLSISRELVRLMGGELGVQSAPGEGSTFHFELRVLRAEGEGVTSRAALALSREARILLCDDNPLLRRSVRGMLASERVELVEASTLEEALSALARPGVPVDVAIIDEGLVGDQAARLAGSLTAACRHVVRLGVRPRPEQAWLPGIRVAQALGKPLRRDALLDCLRGLLAESPAARPLVRHPTGQHRDSFAGARILVVEDNRANQEVALGMLDRLGCEVTIAGDGQECIERLGEGHYDLVLMDCHMPRMDGFEATRRIRESDAAYAAVPIVAMTANVQKSAMDQCQAAGMSDDLSKPIKLGVLREALNRWLQQSPAPVAAVPEAAPRNAANTVVDKAFLDDLRSQIGESADRMVTLFLEDLPGYLKALRVASENQEMAELRRIAHTLKGAAANVGAPRLAQRALALEQEASSGVRSPCEHLVSAVVYESNLVRHVLEGSDALRPEASGERKNAGARQSRILVVDDDRGSRFALRETLLGEGHEVLEASDGQQAVEICRQSAPDLVLLDGVMPVMDGFSACALIRTLPGCATVPVLIVTGLDDEGAVDKAFAAGATDYIAKPINYAVLRRRIEHMLAARSAEERVHQLAYVDSLTGRPNRSKFNEHMDA
ncbi:MAG: response regulator, partial [Gammaproteobacteria bacterium]